MSSLSALLPLMGSPLKRDAFRAGRENDRYEPDRCVALLKAVFQALDHAGIRYCVLHGYERWARSRISDIDAVIDPSVGSNDLLRCIQAVCVEFEAQIARNHEYHVVVTGRRADNSRFFLSLDFATDASVAGLQFYSAEEILHLRRRHEGFWMPAAHIGFAAYLARTIAAGKLDNVRGGVIAALFREDPKRCTEQLYRFWPAESVALLAASAQSHEWSKVLHQMDDLRRQLLRQVIFNAPFRYAGRVMTKLKARLAGALRPAGISLVLLGPDGAGKSSVASGLMTDLAQVFPRIECFGFVPEWFQRLLHGSDRNTDEPHALQPRSPAVSIARAFLYWLPAYMLGYIGQRFELARGALVISDRHFVDVLVDQKRYRYGGPVWVLRAIWRVVPKPDVVVLLDGPPQVLYSRKPEIAVAELARLRGKYLEVVGGLKNGEVVDVDQPLPQVSDEIVRIILSRARERGGRVIRSI